jgi:hypothetical protein
MDKHPCALKLPSSLATLVMSFSIVTIARAPLAHSALPQAATLARQNDTKNGASQNQPQAVIAPQKPNDTEIKSEVRRLLDDLNAPQRATRVAGETRLLELGPRVLPHLPAPELLPSVSVRESVFRIRTELERRQARESMRAARVDMQGMRSLADWLAEIERQSSNRIDAAALPREALQQTIDGGGKTQEFWPAFDELAFRAGFEHSFDDRRRGLRLEPRIAAAAPAATALAYAGPFRFSFPGAERKPGAVLARAERETSDLVRIALHVQSEPRLRPLFLHYKAADFLAKCGAKSALEPLNPDAAYERALPEGPAPARLQFDFLIPGGRPCREIGLAGKLRATVAAGSEQIRFTNALAAVRPGGTGIARRRGGVTVTLLRARSEPVKSGEQELRIEVNVGYDRGGPAFESHRTWILHNEVWLETPQGTRLPLNGGFETTLQADGAVGMQYRFIDVPRSLTNLSFVYVAPTLIVEVPIDFQIESIPVNVSPDITGAKP